MAHESKKSGRIPADLSTDLEYLTSIDAAGFLAALPLEDARVDAADVSGEDIESLSLAGSVVEGGAFARTTIQSALLRMSGW